MLKSLPFIILLLLLLSSPIHAATPPQDPGQLFQYGLNLLDRQQRRTHFNNLAAQCLASPDPATRRTGIQALLQAAFVTDGNREKASLYEQIIARARAENFEAGAVDAQMGKARASKNLSEKIAIYDQVIQNPQGKTIPHVANCQREAIGRKARLLDNNAILINYYEGLVNLAARSGDRRALIRALFEQQMAEWLQLDKKQDDAPLTRKIIATLHESDRPADKLAIGREYGHLGEISKNDLEKARNYQHSLAEFMSIPDDATEKSEAVKGCEDVLTKLAEDAPTPEEKIRYYQQILALPNGFDIDKPLAQVKIALSVEDLNERGRQLDEVIKEGLKGQARWEVVLEAMLEKAKLPGDELARLLLIHIVKNDVSMGVPSLRACELQAELLGKNPQEFALGFMATKAAMLIDDPALNGVYLDMVEGLADPVSRRMCYDLVVRYLDGVEGSGAEHGMARAMAAKAALLEDPGERMKLYAEILKRFGKSSGPFKQGPELQKILAESALALAAETADRQQKEAFLDYVIDDLPDLELFDVGPMREAVRRKAELKR